MFPNHPSAAGLGKDQPGKKHSALPAPSAGPGAGSPTNPPRPFSAAFSSTTTWLAFLQRPVPVQERSTAPGVYHVLSCSARGRQASAVEERYRVRVALPAETLPRHRNRELARCRSPPPVGRKSLSPAKSPAPKIKAQPRCTRLSFPFPSQAARRGRRVLPRSGIFLWGGSPPTPSASADNGSHYSPQRT